MANPRVSHLAATIVFLLLASACVEAAPDRAVAIEVSGTVPGFTHPELIAYLAERLREGVGAPWEFGAGNEEASPSPNRVVWSFRAIRVIWPGGAHRGVSSPSHSLTYLSVEVKLYLNDAYQATILAEPTISGGRDDGALAEVVRYVAHALFAESQPRS